jgi:hypothetical protein
MFWPCHSKYSNPLSYLLVSIASCGLDEKHFVDASFSDQDTLYVFIQSQSMIQANQICVRFHGNVIESVDGLPDHYADVIRITELLAYSVAAPSHCK